MSNSKLGWLQKMRFALAMMRDGRLPFWMKAMIPVATLVYVISPIDLIPDFIVGFGQMDDIAIVIMGFSLLAAFFQKIAPSNIVAEHLSTLFSTMQPQAARAQQDADPIDVDYRVVHDSQW